MKTEIEIIVERDPCPVRGGGGSGFDGCVARNCGAGRCMELRKGKKI